MSALFNKCIKHLEHLVSFDTSNPPKNIEGSGLLDYLKSLDFIKPEITNLGENSYNILCSRGNPRYLFNVHLDTVPQCDGWNTNPLDLIITNSHAIGLGACDIKSAAACILAVIEEGLEDYAVLFSTDEEAGQSRCIKTFAQSKLEYEGIIVAEPTKNMAVTCHRGIATGLIRFHGTSGHSSEKSALENSAIHKQARWSFNALETARKYENKKYESLEGLAFNIGSVSGGIKPNIIAQSAETKFGFRPLPGQDPFEVFTELNAKSVKGQFDFTKGFIAPSLPAKDNSHRLKALAGKLKLELSKPVNFWTEAALFNEAGYDAIVFGPGDIKNAHQPNEYVDLADLKTALKIYKEIIQ